MAYDTENTTVIHRNICNAMWFHHYDGGSNCADDCLLNRLLTKYIERYDPDLAEALASAKHESKVYYVLLQKLCEFAPTAANQEDLEEVVNFCFTDTPEKTL